MTNDAHRMGHQPPLNVSPEIIEQSEQAWKQRALDAEAKLKRYEEREPLVQELLGELNYCECSKRSGGNACDTCQARDAVAGFEVT